jgi:hypothetical protein
VKDNPFVSRKWRFWAKITVLPAKSCIN